MELPDYLPERIREDVEVASLQWYMRCTSTTFFLHKGHFHHVPPAQVGQRHKCPHGCIACVFALVRQMQHGSASALRRSPPPAPSASCAFGRLVQQTEKRRCVSAWSLVHLAEKRRNKQKSALCIVTHGLAAGALLSRPPALTNGNIPVALKNARSYSFSGADFLTSGERLLRKF